MFPCPSLPKETCGSFVRAEINVSKALAQCESGHELNLINIIIVAYLSPSISSKQQAIDQWLYNWNKVYTGARKLELPEIPKNRPRFDFPLVSRDLDLIGLTRLQEAIRLTRGWISLSVPGSGLPQKYGAPELEHDNAFKTWATSVHTRIRPSQDKFRKARCQDGLYLWVTIKMVLME